MASEDIQTLKLGWDFVNTAVDVLALMVKKQRPKLIVAVARGGLIPATMLSHRLGDVPVEVIHVSAYEGTRRTVEKPLEVVGWKDSYNLSTTVVVDDIMDTGDTYDALLYKRGGLSLGVDFKPTLAVLVKKTDAKFINFNTFFAQVPSTTWVEFPWERG